MGHHGGPIHPICGAHAVGQMAKRLRRPWADLAVVQFVTLCNKHVHSPEQGPYIMAEMAPADSNDIFIFREKKLVSEEGGVEVTKETFRRSMRMAYPPAAEATMLYLLENGVTAGEVLDIVLDLAVPKNPSDDHFFLFPMYTWRALDRDRLGVRPGPSPPRHPLRVPRRRHAQVSSPSPRSSIPTSSSTATSP